MTDREKLYRGLSHAAWGYFFLCFNINLGTVNVLPNFVGYILFCRAIGKLSGERRDLKLLRPLCALLAVWNGADWLLGWFGGDVDGNILFLDLLVSAAGIYFQFQFLTDMAALAEAYRPSEDNTLAERLRHRRSAYLVLVTAISLISTQPGQIILQGGGWREWVMIALAVIAVIVALMIMAGLFGLRKFFLPDTEAV